MSRWQRPLRTVGAGDKRLPSDEVAPTSREEAKEEEEEEEAADFDMQLWPRTRGWGEMGGQIQ